MALENCFFIKRKIKLLLNSFYSLPAYFQIKNYEILSLHISFCQEVRFTVYITNSKFL